MSSYSLSHHNLKNHKARWFNHLSGTLTSVSSVLSLSSFLHSLTTMLDVWTHNQPEHTQDPVVSISLTLHTNTHRNKHTGTAEGPVSEKIFPPDWVSSQVKPWTVPTDTKEPRSLAPDCSDMDPVMSPLIQPSTSVSTVSLSSDVYYAKPISSSTLLGDSSSCKVKTKKLRFQCTSKLLNLKGTHLYSPDPAVLPCSRGERVEEMTYSDIWLTKSI